MNDKIDFFNVIRVIEKASINELNAIARVEKAILNNSITSNVQQTTSRRINPRTGLATSIPKTEEKTPNEVAVSLDINVNNGSTSDFFIKNDNDEYEQANNDEKQTVNNHSESINTSHTNTDISNNINNHATDNKKITTSKERPQRALSEVINESESSNETDHSANETQQIIQSKEIIKAVTDASDLSSHDQNNNAIIVNQAQEQTNTLLEGLYHDSKGRLRQSNGAFATRKQKEEFDKNQQNDNKDNSSLLRSVASWVSTKIDSADENKAVDGAGMAVGSSFWVAAKEVKELVSDTVSFLDENGLTSKEGMAENINKAKTTIKNPKETLFNYFKEKKEPGNDSETNNNENSSQFMSPSIENNHKSTAETIRDDASNVDLAAEATNAQTIAFKQWNNEQAELLKDISDNIIATRSGGGGLFDMDSIDLDRKKGKRKNGRLKNKTPNKPNRMASVLSTGGEMASSVISKGAGMGGKLASGIGMAAKGAGKFIPFLAPALAAYDAVSGFTDTEKQKEVFNLKDGEEATTGQKSSMALASVLDMGGLVSGGAGLVGSLFGAMGFDGAKEAMTFDSSSMANGIYSLFSSSDNHNNSKEPLTNENNSSKENSNNSQISSTNNSSQVSAAKETEQQYHNQQVSSLSPTVSNSWTRTNIDPAIAQTSNNNTNTRNIENTESKLPLSNSHSYSNQKSSSVLSSESKVMSEQPGQSNIAMPSTDSKSSQQTFIAQNDPKLTKIMDELLKVTKQNSGSKQGSTVINNSRSTINNSSQDKGGTSNIPTSPTSIQMQAMAADRD